MITAADPRHQKRITLFKNLFPLGFSFPKKPRKPAFILPHLKPIDALIASAAPEWPLEKLNKIDLAILRLAVYELIIEKKNPPKVVIDEAIEIAKQFGTEKTPKFINGVLGTIIKTYDKK